MFIKVGVNQNSPTSAGMNDATFVIISTSGGVGLSPIDVLTLNQGHVFSLFEAVRERSEPGSEKFQVSIELHKKFIQRRIELTKTGSKFSSPACTYTDRDIIDSLDDLKKRREEVTYQK